MVAHADADRPGRPRLAVSDLAVVGRSVPREGGQTLPALLVLVAAILALGVGLFQVARAADLRAGAQSGADASALAAAQSMSSPLMAGLTNVGVISAGAIDQASARAAAVDYAQRNGTTLVDYRPSALGATVVVESGKALDGEAVPDEVRGRRGEATARAEVRLTYLLDLPATAPAGGVSEGELRRLAQAAGTPDPVPPDSALRRYGGNCQRGVDVANVEDGVKVAVLRAEASLGTGLELTSAHRSLACDPQRSMHTYGLAVDVSSPALLATIAEEVDLCQPFPRVDPAHFALASSPECGGQVGTLATGQAFPDLSAYIALDVRLTRLDP